MPPTMFQLEGRNFLARDDAMISGNGVTNSFSLSVLGQHIAQPRMRGRAIFTIMRHPRIIMFDPVHDLKIEFKREVSNALAAVGSPTHPLFANGVRLKVTATFYVFNMRKDLDNLMKFLLDSLQEVVYNNDAMVYKMEAKKVRTTRNLEYTEFEVETLAEA